MDKIKLIFANVKQFLKEAKTELKKVTWPTPKQTVASTSVVIIVVVIIAVFLGVVDFGLNKIIRLALG
jgi:preprotein translocase subunit SecE